MPALTINVLDNDLPIRLAATELARCLRKMTGMAARVRHLRRFDEETPGIFVGQAAHFRSVLGKRCPRDDAREDALLVQSAGAGLVMTGSNPRSVLFAAYRWLEALGARWVRPGKDGEYLPTIDVPALSGWAIRERAKLRHRGVVIEGNCDIDQVLELVEWMPKLRMNAYMLQFRVSAYFWRRWYERTGVRAIKHPHLLSIEECAALDERVAAAVQARGMLLHRVGHGWTAEAVGNHPSGWEKDEPAPAEIRPLLAELGGVRDWYNGEPINTELCYSNPEARRRFVDEVLAYAQAHPRVDVLHIWASDGTNNNCECAQCATMSPSDWYISLLNEIAPRLAEIAPHMRVVALCYSNTMWPPEQVPPGSLGDNFTFMFAPIARCYTHPILEASCREEPVLQPFKRNQVIRPRANADYAAMLHAWKEYLPAGADAFVFDYHFWWNFPSDWLSTDYATMLRDDVRQYRRVGIHGMMSCQTQRTSMPTALSQYALARYLWNPDVTSATVIEEYFAAAFGSHAELARDCYTAFLRATRPCRKENAWWRHVSKGTVRAVRRVLRDFAPPLRAALRTADNPVHRRSLYLLHYFLRYQQLLWAAFAAHEQGRPDAPQQLEKAAAFLLRTESSVYRWVETMYWVNILRHSIMVEWEKQDALQRINERRRARPLNAVDSLALLREDRER